MRSRRTDARRNRQAILRVADAAFAQGTEVVPLAEIARRAGLGRATVYRHFPDRQALGAAVAAQQIGMLRRVADAEGEGVDFRCLMHLVLADQIARRPLVQLFRELSSRDQRRYIDSLIGALTPAFRRAQAGGQIRGDLEPADLVLVFEMVEAALTSPFSEADRGAAAERLLPAILDGLCIRSASR